jgi:hypothetical protein
MRTLQWSPRGVLTWRLKGARRLRTGRASPRFLPGPGGPAAGDPIGAHAAVPTEPYRVHAPEILDPTGTPADSGI